METRHMHKSLFLQQQKYTRLQLKQKKENEKPASRAEVLGENAHQKFKSLLQKQKNNLYPKKLRQIRAGKENHSFVNVGNKENLMGIANARKAQPHSGPLNAPLMRAQNRKGDLNISISKHCKSLAQECRPNTTSLHMIVKEAGEERGVLQPLNENMGVGKLFEEPSGTIEEETVLHAPKLRIDVESTVDRLSEDKSFELTQKKALGSLCFEGASFFAEKRPVREACDPVEFFMEKIGKYYDRLIAERGANGSIAVGGNIFDVQKSLKQRMRVILFDWLFDLCQKWKMKLRTFVITLTFTDAVLIRCMVTKEIFQLVGLACLFIAGKFEEIYPPSLEEYLDSCNHAYSREQLLQIETIILNSVQFNLVILNHLDLLELNLKQRLRINGRALRVYAPGLSPTQEALLEKLRSLSEMFLMICLYDHRVHLMNMHSVVDFCIINALRFLDRGNVRLSYRGVDAGILQGFSHAAKDVEAFLGGMGGMGLAEFQMVEKMMKEMMKSVFDLRQYSIIIKYRFYFVKILRAYFDM